jgi:FAD/FMN-containing dehydrogenase
MPNIEIAAMTGRKVVLNADVIEQFRTGLRGGHLLRGDDGYDAARKIYNAMIDHQPAIIARCAGIADVIGAVNFARSNGLLVSVRGGGHNVSGNAACDGGLMIDLSPMKSVRVDPESKTARAEPGVTWGEFDHKTQAFGLATTGGLVSTTGIAGLTLGGGLGWLMGNYGLACDNLISVDVVTADGQLLTASKSRNEDLFWGLRGGGDAEVASRAIGQRLDVLTARNEREIVAAFAALKQRRIGALMIAFDTFLFWADALDGCARGLARHANDRPIAGRPN